MYFKQDATLKMTTVSTQRLVIQECKPLQTTNCYEVTTIKMQSMYDWLKGSPIAYPHAIHSGQLQYTF